MRLLDTISGWWKKEPPEAAAQANLMPDPSAPESGGEIVVEPAILSDRELIDTIWNAPQTGRDWPYGWARRAYHVHPLNVSGVPVDERNALTFSAVWTAVRAISEPLAAMPFRVFKREGKNQRTQRPDHQTDWIISMQPNPEINAFNFWDTIVQYALTWGNAYAEIERNQRGEAIRLWQIEPWRVSLRRNDQGELEYLVVNQRGDNTVLPVQDMFHLHGLGDGLLGYSIIRMARETIGLGLAMEQFGAAFFGNGATLGGIIEAPAGLNLSKPAVDAMMEEFNARHRGARNAQKAAYLDGGMKFTSSGVPPEDAQFLQSRQFSVAEVARWFRVPPHLLYDLTRSTFNHIEQMGLEYVSQTLAPWARRIELECDIKLFGNVHRGVYYTRMDFASMLRGDTKSQNEAWAVGRQNGWLSANDIRGMQELNPIVGQGGDEYLVNANMIPLDQLREKIKSGIDATNNPPEPQQQQADDVGAGGGADNQSKQPGKAKAAVIDMARRYAESVRR